VHQHLFDQLEEARGSGDFNVLGEIDRSLFKKGNPGAIPVQIQCQCVVYHKNNGITLHEFFGIGSGKRVSEEELKKFGHYGVSESSSGSLSQARKTADGLVVPVVHDTRDTEGGEESKDAEPKSLAQRKTLLREKRQLICTLARTATIDKSLLAWSSKGSICRSTASMNTK
jgi:hypothetical protein